MTEDIDLLARQALGEPPEDPEARDRALASLRAQIAAESNREPSRGIRGRALVALGVAVVTIALIVARLPGQAPAAALATLRDRAVATSVVSRPGETLESHAEMFGEQHHTDVQTGAMYALNVRSSVDTTTNADGSSVRTETIRSVAFPTPQDEATWEAQGSRELPRPGDVHTVHLSSKDTSWFNPEAISEDPAETLAALRGGEVSELPAGDDHVFLLIGELLAQPTLTTGQRSALFNAAAMLDGVERLGAREDPLGRTGEAFGLEVDGHRTILTFDQTTGSPLSAEYLYVGSGAEEVLDWIAYEGTEVVSDRQQSPA